LLLNGARAVCTAATGFADVAALQLPSLSTTEAFAARTIRLLCRDLFCSGAALRMRDSDAWVQLCCSAGACCVHSCHRIRRCGGAGNAEFKHN